MLNPRQDRIDYSSMLTPPKGMQIKQAVGTTYSVDLETFLSIPLAMAFSQEPTDALRSDKVFLLTAIRRVAGKITVFCQKGSILANKSITESVGLHGLLENSLIQVLLPSGKSFHPKMWVLWFEDPHTGKQRMRVLVMSRNLTYDRSLDAAVCFEGDVSKGKTSDAKQPSPAVNKESIKPLIDFVRWLGRQTSNFQCNALLDAMQNTNLLPIDGPITGVTHAFFPMGIFGYMQYKLPMLPCLRQAVLSPFLVAGDVEQYSLLAEQNQTLLFSRLDQINQISRQKPIALQHVDSYVVSDQAYSGELNTDFEAESNEEALSVDLHAKVYVREFAKSSELWLGSANLSHRAFHGNVELMVRLSGKASEFQVEKIRQELVDDSNLFAPWVETPPNPDEAERLRLDQEATHIQQGILLCQLSAKVVAEDNFYQLHLSIGGVPAIPESAAVKITPMGMSDYIPFQNGCFIFSPFQVETLTQYYVISIQIESMIKKFVLKIDTSDLPSDREQKIVDSIIQSRDDFMRHIAILLSDTDQLGEMIGESGVTGNSSLLSARKNSTDLPLYEQLLKMAAREPYRLAWVEQDISHLSERKDAIVPEEFTQLWQSFIPFIKHKE